MNRQKTSVVLEARREEDLMREREIVGKYLKDARLAAGFVSPEVASEAAAKKGLNISRQHIYKLEAGLANFEIKTLEEVLSLYGLTLTRFFERFGVFKDLPKKDQRTHEQIQAVLDHGRDADAARLLVQAVYNQLGASRRTGELS